MDWNSYPLLLLTVVRRGDSGAGRRLRRDSRLDCPLGAFDSWFLNGGFGVGISLFELSIGLWIATEIVVKFPNIYGRISSGISVLVIQQLFGSPVIESFKTSRIIGKCYFILLLH